MDNSLRVEGEGSGCGGGVDNHKGKAFDVNPVRTLEDYPSFKRREIAEGGDEI